MRNSETRKVIFETIGISLYTVLGVIFITTSVHADSLDSQPTKSLLIVIIVVTCGMIIHGIIMFVRRRKLGLAKPPRPPLFMTRADSNDREAAITDKATRAGYNAAFTATFLSMTLYLNYYLFVTRAGTREDMFAVGCWLFAFIIIYSYAHTSYTWCKEYEQYIEWNQ